MKSAPALVAWLALTFCAALTGIFIQPAGYYDELVKPAWSPPAWVFGPVWTVLYIMMAVAAWLVWQCGGWRKQSRPLGIYLVQLALNALWTPLFFGLRSPGLAFAEILVLCIFVILTLRAFFRVRPVAGWLLAPYGLWTGFAAALNFAIWRLQA
ncbi:MAG: tryptophan-rich sensory protein [Chthoniobacterales bacterium]|nr:tryptophan-rich sensory protein [Chthoniobacterales bacterium]